ncbi:MAG: LURP-one-related family protein [Thaumarchaeota archaeon]|nr:LURP-one-related family protein [Nitrososphaerota archaeon]
MPYCTSCGREISSGATFCPFCGQPTNENVSTIPAPTTTSDPRGSLVSGLSLLDAREIVMKKKIMSMREHYDFEDSTGRKLGEGGGNFFQVPARFVVQSASDDSGNPVQEVMHIDGKLLSLRHEFKFYDASGTELGSLKKKIAKFIGQEYWLEQNETEMMRVYGDFTAHEYQMAVNGQIVAQVHKKWISMRDQFEVSIIGNVDPRLVIGSTIVVEHVEVTRRNNQGSY